MYFLSRKPLLAVSAGVLAAASLVQAIDLDEDGIDDLYALRYGVAGQDPQSDPDADGFSILTESFFHTDPADATDRPNLVLEIRDGLRLRWLTKPGIAYRFQSSTDLSAWIPDGALQIGAGGVLEMPIAPGSDLKYYRLGAEPVDSDRDGLSETDESLLGTDPRNPDSDGDGLGDGFEASDSILDPTTANDPCADNNGSGVPDIEDYAASLGANLVRWSAPGSGNWHIATNWNTGAVPGPEDVVLISPCDANGPVITVSAEDAQAAAVIGNGSLVINRADFQLGSRMVVKDLTFLNSANLLPGADVYAQLHVHVSGNLQLEAGSAIDLSESGYPAREGPGVANPFAGPGSGSSGGSHAGRGGRGRFNPLEGLGATYGSIMQPTGLGSGGSRGSGNDGAGGGALRLVVGGLAQVDGFVAADGRRDAASGAGGSIWMNCSSFAGSGTIRANGAGAGSIGGAGGGGRVAVYHDSATFSGELQARTGATGNAGGAGSVFTKRNSAPRGTLVYDNGGRTNDANLTPIVPDSLKFDVDIIVRGEARISSPVLLPLEIETGGDLTVEADGAIDLTGRGHLAGQGPGVAVDVAAAGSGASGGSHAGEGTLGRLVRDPFAVGATYGSITEPSTMGSGGSRGDSAGGGALRLQVGGLFTVNGLVAADGERGGGAGAGGSLWMDIGNLQGSGVIRANGGAGTTNTGSGGGGRISLTYDDMSGYTGELEAAGGSANAIGGAGSIYLKHRQSPKGQLRYDNNGFAGAPTVLVDSELTLNTDLEISGGARLTGLLGQTLRIDIPGDLHVAASGLIDLTGRGNASYMGTGAPPVPNLSQASNGASYAAHGGHGWLVDRPAPGLIHGSIEEPADLGSGAATRGGGALRLNAGSVVADGDILANGEAKAAPASTGSGGSIWVTCDSFSGSGKVAASGGLITGPQVQLGGAGSGGRVAIYANVSSFTGIYESMSHADDSGGAGTFYLSTGGLGSLLIDNGNHPAAEPTMLPSDLDLGGDFVVRGQAWVRPEETFTGLFALSAGGDITIADGSRIDYSERALGARLGLSQVSPCIGDLRIGGYSHGGEGGMARFADECEACIGMLATRTTTKGSYPYGSAYNPRLTGSGGIAGGAIFLKAGSEIRVDGTITANAGEPSAQPTPGSSGGSIFLSADSVSGAGRLEANGGNARMINNNTPVGSGGGGRIAVYSRNTISQDLIGSVREGSDPPDGSQPGGPGTFVKITFPMNLVTGSIEEIVPPADVRADVLESASAVRIYPEQSKLLSQVDPVNIITPCQPNIDFGFVNYEAVNPGIYDQVSELGLFESPSQMVTSYRLHADPPAGSQPVLTGSVTFGSDIVGVIATASAIDASHLILGGPVLRDDTSGLELNAGDSFQISADRRTLTVTFDTSDGLDQLRVVTVDNPLNN